MTNEQIVAARADIEGTGDLFLRAMKLAGVVSTLFREQGVPLVVVGGSAVEFYTGGGYMSGDIDFCRRSLKAPSLRLVKDLLGPLGGKCIGRSWLVCDLFVDILGIVEGESSKDCRRQVTAYGEIDILPPELLLVERVFFALESEECVQSAKQMMLAALNDEKFDWAEARRIADLPDFKILDGLERLKGEVQA